MATETIKEKGKPEITFQKGGLHKSLHVPLGEKIPSHLREAALRGLFGKKAEKQARFAKNVLKH